MTRRYLVFVMGPPNDLSNVYNLIRNNNLIINNVIFCIWNSTRRLDIIRTSSRKNVIVNDKQFCYFYN